MDAIDVGIASLGLPADVLDVILKYSDLRTRYAAVHVCHEFCDSYERLSPQLEFGLLLKRFPLLGTVMEAEVAARGLATVQNFKQEVRELFRTYSRFEDDDEVTPELVPTVGLDAYTLALELEVNGPGPSKRSLFVGTGRVDDASENDKAMYKFEVDEGIVAEVDDLDQPLRLRARIIATRRKGDRIQHAKLFCGQEEDGDPDFVSFGFQNLPGSMGSTGVR